MAQAAVLALGEPRVVRAEGGGALVGQVRFEGGRQAAPERKPLDMSADAYCCNLCKEKPVLSEGLLVSEDGGVCNAIVYLKKGLTQNGPVPPDDNVLLDQKGCIFVPHVLTLQIGQKLLIRNSDHNLNSPHGLCVLNREFNFAQPNFGMEKEIAFRKAEIFKTVCEVHPWESAYVGVFAHPFHAVTSDAGAFEMKGVPPGEYEVAVWHETCGEVSRAASLTAGQTCEVNFTIGARKPER